MSVASPVGEGHIPGYGLDLVSGTLHPLTGEGRPGRLPCHVDVGVMPDDAHRLKQVIRDLQFENDLLRSEMAQSRKGGADGPSLLRACR